MKNSLSRRFTIAMIILAVGLILVFALVTQLALGWNFERYLDNVQEQQNRLILGTLADLYSESTSWQSIRLATLYVGNTTGAQIRVFDAHGDLIVDSLTGMMQRKHGRHWQNAQQAKGNTYSYPLVAGQTTVGTVEITHLGQEGLWTTEALVFQQTVQQSGLITGLLAAVAAIILAGLLARRLTARLQSLTETADKWGSGQIEARVEVDGEDELAVLGTTMNRMAAKIADQNALRRKLTGDISHELRTPLTTIQSYLEAFRDDVLPPDEENIAAVLEESTRLGSLVNDLQELANADFHTRNVTLKVLDFNELLQTEVERLKPLLQRKELDLQLELPAQTEYVRADETLLGRVLNNLLNNAYKYTPLGGVIKVTLFQQAAEVGLVVKDTGIGIAAEHLPYLFERFYRVDPSRARTTGGSGIGLAIVKELVEAMGGRVTVESEPGEGSSFSVYLPRP
ncbi:MAG TPA: ATP-binding protein [Oscillospiraceae bacterium]|nr:ATP-binding protein [Oscillospiraceae bacterium]